MRIVRLSHVPIKEADPSGSASLFILPLEAIPSPKPAKPEPNMTLSQVVIPEAILIGNPDCNPLKSWMPDKVIRA